jgi:hypothetical protein
MESCWGRKRRMVSKTPASWASWSSSSCFRRLLWNTSGKHIFDIPLVFSIPGLGRRAAGQFTPVTVGKTKETAGSRKHCPPGSTSGAVGAEVTPVTVGKTKETAGSMKHCPPGSASGAVGAEFTPVTVTEKSKDKRNKKNAVSETLSTWLNQWRCGGPVHSGHRGKDKRNSGVNETERQSLCTWLNQWRCGGPVHSGHRGKDKRNSGVNETERQSLCTWLSQWRCGGRVHSGHRYREIERQKKQKERGQ